MATPKKRPSVKNKKTVRPASRQAATQPAASVAETPAPEETSVREAVPVAQDNQGAQAVQDAQNVQGAVAFPAMPSVAEPPKANIPFADEPSAPAEDGPADFFDLGEGASAQAASSNASRASAGKATHPRARASRDGGAGQVRAGSGKETHPRNAAGRAARPANAAKGAIKTSGKSIKKIVLGVIGALAVVAIAVGAFFVWNTFLRYDDAADIQGEWRTQDNAMTVVIDGSNIRMPDLEYSYEIDTGAKRLTFHFSDLTGAGTYSFSGDRSTLTIVEGEGDAATTTVLVKVSGDTQATPQLIDQTASDAADDKGDAANAEEGDAASDDSEQATDAADEGSQDAGDESSDEA